MNSCCKHLTAAALVVAAVAATTSVASAHAPKVGVNGGPQANAGSFHVEVVPQGKTLQVFVRDHGDKAVRTDGFKGTAIFVIDGRAERIPLVPAGDNRMTGTSPAVLPQAPKGAVQLTVPSGSTAQAKFD